MNLPAPVVIQPPPFIRSTGEVRIIPPFTVSELDVWLSDSAMHKRVDARIVHFPRPVVLWEKDAYDAAGDYTQAQAEARLLEVLGPDIRAGLEGLFTAPRPAA